MGTTDVQVVITGGLAAAARAVADELTGEDVPARLAGQDATLWGEAAEAEASIRLGWLDLPDTSRELVDRLATLRAELLADGLDHVVLAGMGGSSLAPEVITRGAGVPLTVLDTTDPGQVRSAIGDRLSRTVVVVSSKSGGTVETDSHRRAYAQAFRAAGLADDEVGRRFIVVTDPGSPLERTATELGARAVFLAAPDVGGRYSALSAFGLVPSALAGVDIAALLAEAQAVAGLLGKNEANPGLQLGAALGAAWRTGHDKVAIVHTGADVAGFGDWAEQLVAESTGKQGRGLLPVVVEGAGAPGGSGPDVATVLVSATPTTPATPAATGADSGPPTATVTGPVGAQFLVWEYATALAGRVIGINPFDQPNVAESKENTTRILTTGATVVAPSFTDGPVDGYGDAGLLAGVVDLTGAIHALLAAAPGRGYLAVMAYLDRHADAAAAGLRQALASRTDRAVTFGWGPRFLHSTGQYHKGGPAGGCFLQLTGATVVDLPVPGRPFTFGELQAAQAAGDIQALASRGYPVLRLHLNDRAAGIARLLAAVQ